MQYLISIYLGLQVQTCLEFLFAVHDEIPQFYAPCITGLNLFKMSNLQYIKKSLIFILLGLQV